MYRNYCSKNNSSGTFNNKEAFKWYAKAAELNHAGAQRTLGVLYYLGEGVKQDYKLSYAWYSIASANGNDATQSRDKAASKLTPKTLEEAKAAAVALMKKIERNLAVKTNGNK